MQTISAVLAGVLLLCLAALPDAAAETMLPPVGATARGRIELFGKRIPLPPGEWRVAAGSFGYVTGEDHGPYGTIGNVLLIRSTDAERSFVLIRTNAVPVRSGWGAPAACIDDGALWKSVAEPRDLHDACTFVLPVRSGRIAGWIGDAAMAHLLPPWALIAGFRVSDRNDVIEARYGDRLWANARAQLAETHVIAPPTVLEVGARAGTHENFVDVRYYFPSDEALTRAGLSLAQLGVPRVADTPVLLERVVALLGWADLVQMPIEQGVRGRLPTASAALPWPWEMAAVRAALISQAHAPLERLHAVGAIDDADLQRQRALAGAALAKRERQRWSLWARSAYKVATYRILSYFDTIAVSWIITLSPGQSLTYATINGVAQPIMAYANEIDCAGSGVGRAAASLQPVDFPDLGRDRL
jgi:hypothetical protein